MRNAFQVKLIEIAIRHGSATDDNSVDLWWSDTFPKLPDEQIRQIADELLSVQEQEQKRDRDAPATVNTMMQIVLTFGVAYGLTILGILTWMPLGIVMALAFIGCGAILLFRSL